MATVAASSNDSSNALPPELWRGLPPVRYGLLILAVLAQAATLWITQPLWQVRDTPVHMPVFELPQVPFYWAMQASLVVVLLWPHRGVALHAGLLLVSFVFDQFRTQPQFIALVALMLAMVIDNGMILVRWFLATLWIWAGLHKLLSPDWFTSASWNLVGGIVTDRATYYVPFAWGVSIGEITVGLLAVLRPRWAALPCVMMHVGIAIFLTPLFYNHNESVIPWNLASGIVGGWVMWHVPSTLPRFAWEWVWAALLLIYPAAFYVGWVDHGIASVLYSNHLPEGLITTADGTEKIRGWGELKVPFPNERRLLLNYFQHAAPPGSKLHIDDQRVLLPDLYYVKREDGRIEQIAREEFLRAAPGEVAGMELDRLRHRFLLARAGAKMLRREEKGPIYAVQMDPKRFRPELLELLEGIPNIEQLNLAECDVSDEDLKRLPFLPRLQGIGLSDTPATDAAIPILMRQPALIIIQYDGSNMTTEAILKFERQRPL